MKASRFLVAGCCLLGGWVLAEKLPPASAPAFEEVPPGIQTRPVRSVRTPPVEVLRELVGRTTVEREQLLKERAAVHRELLRSKVQELASLSPSEREARLKELELRWHLLTLMQAPVHERPALLEQVRPEHRALIAGRLSEWDRLPAITRAGLIQNHFALDYFSNISGGTPARWLASLGVSQRAQVEAEVVRWNALPAEQRERLQQEFGHFFELSGRQQERVVAALPEASRAGWQTTLQALEQLAPAERERCLEALRRFAAMTPVERGHFLANLERWQRMTPMERTEWREVAGKLPPEPPLPPGLLPTGVSAGVMPPLPR